MDIKDAILNGIEHPESVWRVTAKPSASFDRLSDDHDTDVLVVGGGFTGLSTARELLAREIDCVVLEGQDIGWGASGRTGGFAVPRFKANYSTLAQTCGDETATTLFHQAVNAVDSVADTVEAFDIDCDFQRNGHLTPAHSQKALAGLRADVDWLHDRAGDRTARLLSREQTQEALGTTLYHGAYFDERGACIHPYNYARGLAAGLTKRGIPIFVGAQIVSLHRRGDYWDAETARARVRARKVVLATNAYTQSLRAKDNLYRRVVPVTSSVITTRPLDSSERQKTVPSTLPATDTRRIVRYFRMLPTGQLLFGGRGDITGQRDDPAVYRSLERQLVSTFPHLAGVEIQQRWSGKVAVTPDNFPHVGRLDEGLFFALGYGGRGVALTSLMGRHLAAMVADESLPSGPMTTNNLRPIPFHRWRRIGMRIMAKYYGMRDFFEH